MVNMHGVTNGYYGKYAAGKTKLNGSDNAAKAKGASSDLKSSESKLSEKAQKYLDKLRKDYGDYDFVIADAGDDMKGLLSKTDKEFSVVFSSDELEKMADDEKFAAKQMQSVETAVDMSKKISEELASKGNGIQLNSVSVTFDDKGTRKLFAELEQSTADQNETMEKIAEKRAEDKKNAEKAKEKKANGKNKDAGAYESAGTKAVKRVTVEAPNIDNMLKKIAGIDWDKVPAQTVAAGDVSDFSA